MADQRAPGVPLRKEMAKMGWTSSRKVHPKLLMAGAPYLARVDLALQIAGTHHPVGEHAAAVQVAAQSLIQQLHRGFLQQLRLHHWGGGEQDEC